MDSDQRGKKKPSRGKGLARPPAGVQIRGEGGIGSLLEGDLGTGKPKRAGEGRT